MNFNELHGFVKELNRLAEKYISLPNDLIKLKEALVVVPLGNGKRFNIITKNEQCAVIKTRLSCRYLKGDSLRVIYSFYYKTKRIDFIEIYFKGDKENEDRKRIKEYLNPLDS